MLLFCRTTPGRRRHRCRDLSPIVPGDVGRQDERRDPAGRVLGRGDRRGGIGAGIGGARGTPGPTIERVGDGHDVRVQRGVVALVVSRVIADHIDDRTGRPPRVVQVRVPVRQPRPEMQQSRGGLTGNARVAVGGSRHHTFEQPEHSSHPRNRVQGGDEVHLRRPGIREADLHATLDEGPYNRLRTVHCSQIPRSGRYARGPVKSGSNSTTRHFTPGPRQGGDGPADRAIAASPCRDGGRGCRWCVGYWRSGGGCGACRVSSGEHAE